MFLMKCLVLFFKRSQIKMLLQRGKQIIIRREVDSFFELAVGGQRRTTQRPARTLGGTRAERAAERHSVATRLLCDRRALSGLRAREAAGVHIQRTARALSGIPETKKKYIPRAPGTHPYRGVGCRTRGDRVHRGIVP